MSIEPHSSAPVTKPSEPVINPWDVAMTKLGMNQNQLAIELKCDRSKISRARKPEKGDVPLIDARTQVKLLKLAKKLGVELTKEDLIPDV